MKHLITSLVTLAALSLNSATALAHTGHFSAETAHSFLHAEHILVLAALGVIAVVVKVLIKK